MVQVLLDTRLSLGVALEPEQKYPDAKCSIVIVRETGLRIGGCLPEQIGNRPERGMDL